MLILGNCETSVPSLFQIHAAAQEEYNRQMFEMKSVQVRRKDWSQQESQMGRDQVSE